MHLNVPENWCQGKEFLTQSMSTQPGHPFVRKRNEYQPKDGDALRMGSKGTYGWSVGDLNSFSNRTSPADNSNDRWKRLCLVSWAAASCIWMLRALTRNSLTYSLTYLLTYFCEFHTHYLYSMQTLRLINVLVSTRCVPRSFRRLRCHKSYLVNHAFYRSKRPAFFSEIFIARL